jgi:hypothetical protein
LGLHVWVGRALAVGATSGWATDEGDEEKLKRLAAASDATSF